MSQPVLRTGIVPIKGDATHSNVTVDSSRDLLAAANPNRISITFQNQGASDTVYLGDVTVTSSSTTAGYALAAGATFTDNATTGAWYGVTASGSSSVHVIEVA